MIYVHIIEEVRVHLYLCRRHEEQLSQCNVESESIPAEIGSSIADDYRLQLLVRCQCTVVDRRTGFWQDEGLQDECLAEHEVG